MRCLITGATGFVGTHLAHELADKCWEVHAILRLNSDADPLQRKENPIKLYRYDGTIDSMIDIVHCSNPDIVFHLASLVKARHHQPQDVGPMIESNVLFGSYLLEAMFQQGIANLINTSTASQHYNQQVYSPTCLYAATKQAYESILTYYTEVHGLRAITLTLFDTYGPKDRRKKLLQLLQEASVTNKLLDLTPGEQLIDLVHIDDVIRGYMAAADILLKGNCSGSQKFMLSSGTPIQIKELIKRYEQVTGCSLKINWGGKPYQVREIMIPWNRGIPLPGWQAKVSLDEGLKTLDSVGKGCTNVDKQKQSLR